MKSKKKTAVTHVPPGKKVSPREHLANFAANRAKQIKSGSPLTILVFILLGAAAWYFLDIKYAGGTALLYLFAFDGTVSGRMDGNVLSRNGTGRKFTYPTLVQNAATATARTLLALISSTWSTLTQSEQNSWLEVTNQFYTNRLGVTKAIKGKALFCQRNINLLLSGNGLATAYPGNTAVLGITSFDPTGATTTGALTALSAVFSGSPTDVDVVHLIFGTAVQGPGINRPKQSAYRLIGSIAAAGTSPQNILAVYTAKFGAIATTGQKIGLKLVPININTGQAGTDIVQIVTLT